MRACAVAGVVDVWRMDLDGAPEWLEDLLCARERVRAARIVHERDRVRWARSRGMVRLLLARYLDADPRELRFELGAHGKPRLPDRAGGVAGPPDGAPDGAPGGAWPDLRFSLSHSRELLLVAVAADVEVGVDVECANERHTAEFMRTWTMHEATVKCLGTGLSTMPAGDEAPPGGLWRTELDVGPYATAALAVELTPPRASAPRPTRAVRAGCPAASA